MRHPAPRAQLRALRLPHRRPRHRGRRAHVLLRALRAPFRRKPHQGPGVRRQIRYAVVGLGHIAQVAVLPAFANARRNSRLAGLVSGDPLKRAELARKYGVERTWSYEDYDACLKGGEIDAVYIALPNALHHEYALRAAQAGIHVLCEKPMALDEGQCQRMGEAARAARVRLMVAYRLHFERANLEAIEVLRSG